MTTTVAGELAGEREESAQYAGFWLRLKAGLIDFVILLPLFLVGFWATTGGPAGAVAYSMVSSAVYFAYSIAGHAIWGQTLGKHVVRIRVVDVTGRRIGWRQAVRRSSVDIILGVIAQVAYTWVILRIPVAEFEALTWVQIQNRYVAERPTWAAATEYVYWAWLASEVVSVLFNKRRRALHDFIAGTVVVKEAPESAHIAMPLRGWRRALSLTDNVLATLALIVTVLFSLVALGTPADDAASRSSTTIVAAYSAILAAAYTLAGRSVRRGSRRTWIMHAVALLLTCLPFIPLLVDTAAAPRTTPPPAERASPLA